MDFQGQHKADLRLYELEETVLEVARERLRLDASEGLPFADFEKTVQLAANAFSIVSSARLARRRYELDALFTEARIEQGAVSPPKPVEEPKE